MNNISSVTESRWPQALFNTCMKY